MTKEEKIKRYIGAAAATGVTTLVVTIVAWRIGAKNKHPIAGALIGFFLVSPIVCWPVTLIIAGDALAEDMIPPSRQIVPPTEG